MSEIFRQTAGKRTTLVLTADEFASGKKGYVIYESTGKYFGNPSGAIFKSKKDAIQQAKLRSLFSR